MVNRIFPIVIIVLLMASNSFAGLYSSQYDTQSSSVISAVQIKDKGIFNLVVSLNLLRKPQDKKIYTSDEYEELINRLSVEWRGIATQKILEKKELSVGDLIELQKSIHSEVTALVNKLKKQYLPEQNTEVIFSISNFFLLEPKDE